MREVRIPSTAAPGPGSALRVEVEGHSVAVFNLGGELLGIDARCPHVGGPLDRGRLSDHTVTCPLHGSQFDVRTGALQRGPAIHGVKSYPVRVEGADLLVGLD